VRSIRHSFRWLIAALAFLQIACSSPDAGSAGSEAPHGNHDPKHGGLVLMDGDLHFEVVVQPPGEYRLYFSDAVRKDLPASTAREATMSVTQWGEKPVTVTLSPDVSGANWFGKGPEVHDPDATLRVTYLRSEKPYFIDLPFASVANPPSRADH
jgi:hypothetical protein